MSNSLSAEEAIRLTTERLTKAGVPASDASQIATHLVRAERRGYPSHGLRRLPALLDLASQRDVAQQRTRSIDMPGLMIVDAHGSLGIPSVETLLSSACERAATSGAVVAGVRNFYGTTGCLGIYGSSLADEGFASILMCHSEFAVAPHGTRRAIIGTNPIAIAVPYDGYHFVADLATSAWSYGAIRDAMLTGIRIPEGIVQTENGEPSTDPHDADNGSQLPMAGHKGYAIGLAIELLCGPLLGAKAGRDAVPGSDALLAVIIACDAIRPSSAAKDDMRKLFDEITVAPLARGHNSVRIPGASASEKEASSARISVSSDVMALLEDK